MICRICGENRKVEEMVINHTTPKKIHYKDICKPCSNEKSRLVNALRKDNPIPDNHTCPICLEQSKKWYLDHNWTTGEFRGYLCNACNIALGLLKDNKDYLMRAIAYLDSYQVN